MNTLALMGGSPGMGEILLILIVVLLLFGSKKVPEVARNLGRAMSEFRRAARNLQDELAATDRDPPPPPAPDDPSRTRDDEPAGEVSPPPESGKDGPHEGA